MSPEDVASRVFGVNRAQIDDSTSNSTLPEWDSMGHINLILELEATYGVAFSSADAFEMRDVATIKRVLQSHGSTW